MPELSNFGFRMEYFDIIVVSVVVVFIIISLYTELMNPVTTFIVGISALAVTKILSSDDILSGFANEQIAVIVLLLILGHIVQKTSVVDLYFAYLFQRAKTYKGFLMRLMAYVSVSSAFFNNTPLVAMMIPYIQNWSRKNNISSSKLLIPLSYAAIMGGSATLIGTSTNLIVNGLAIESGHPSINIFEFTWVGLPMVVIGFFYMYFVGHKLLPNRKDVLSDFNQRTKEYLVEAKIEEGSKLIGKTVEDAGLVAMQGYLLVELIRNDYRLTPIKPTRTIQKDDILIFASDTENVFELYKHSNGLTFPEEAQYISKERTNIAEIVIAKRSGMIGRPVNMSGMRDVYDASVIAVHRNGTRLAGKLGEIILRAGDHLLMFTGEEFQEKSEDISDFYVISSENEVHKIGKVNRLILIWGLITTILLSAMGFISLFKALIVFLSAILIFKIATFDDIRRSIDIKLIAIASLALGLGKAMINTGLAENAAHFLISLLQPFGIIGMMAGIFIITNLLASYMTNIAAVSIVFPVSFALGNELVANGQLATVMPFMLIVAYGASANYITPIGYFTNIMVYGSGNYKFKDFFKVGIPMAILHMITAITVLSLVYIY